MIKKSVRLLYIGEMSMNRTEAIQNIVKKHPDGIFIFSNGLTTRLAVELLGLDGPFFYLLHGMGETLSVGIGMASALSKEVVVIEGDGNALMGLASWPQIQLVKNLHYYILDNGKHATTGGQSIIDFSDFDNERINRIKIQDDLNIPPIPPSPKLIIESFRKSIHG